MLIPNPMPFGQQAEAFDDPAWIYELTHDGFRALLAVEQRRCRFFSGTKQKLYGYRDLREALVREVNAQSAMLDGELVVTDAHERRGPAGVMPPGKQARYCAFDLLWLDGEDLRGRPLLSRKEKLKLILPSRSLFLFYVDHAIGSGLRLYELACEMDLDGIVAKRADSLYDDNPNGRNWMKINNSHYGQRAGRRDQLKRAG